jgi:hypothetical protein
VVASLKNEVCKHYYFHPYIRELTNFQRIDAQLISLTDIVAETYGTDLYKQTIAYDTLGARFFDELANKIGETLESCGKKVPVVTGMHTQTQYHVILTNI